MAKGTSRNRRADDNAGVRVTQGRTPISGAQEGQPRTDRELTLSRPDRVTEASAARDRVQAPTDHDLVRADDCDAYASSKGVRQRTARHRQHTAQARLDDAAGRDAIALGRDGAALARDRDAVARDLALAERDSAEQRDTAAPSIGGAEIVRRAVAARTRAAKLHVQRAEHLALVACDRAAAARDREHAADQRRQARADLDALAHHVAIIETDALTGARSLAAGLIDLEHERDRCRATSAALVLAYVHIDATSNVRDIRGHDASDEVLRRLVASIHDHLRGYDLVIRFAANDFVCAMSNMTETTARRRFTAIAAANSDAFTIGFAALASSHESTIELITRADNTRR
jgi:diguanylate cyclase (GGDEF)-like protein